MTSAGAAASRQVEFNHDDVVAAAELLCGKARLTPLLESAGLNALVGGRLLVKAEMLQLGGSFKFRGAYNYISRLDDAAKQQGVLTFSSGNLAQGIAIAAGMLGVPATIVMPADAPAIKIADTRRTGAEIVLYDRRTESREALAPRVAAERRLVYEDPHEQRDMLIGYGTAGLEIVAQASAMGVDLDALLVPCSGGGLVAGCALATGRHAPRAAVFGVEPEAYDDTARSFAAGHIVQDRKGGTSICDGLLAIAPGHAPFSINQKRLSGILTVSDAEVMAAMSAAFRELKIVVEPSRAVALAAALSGKIDCAGKTTAIVCSGGNVDPGLFAAAIQTAA